MDHSPIPSRTELEAREREILALSCKELANIYLDRRNDKEKRLRAHLRIFELGHLAVETALRQHHGPLGTKESMRLGLSPAYGRETHIVPTALDFVIVSETTGKKDGYPVVFFHGMPGSRREKTGSTDTILHAYGVRGITYDRPGKAFSPPLPGRLPVHSVADVHALANYHFLKQEFSVLAGSGGCNDALACATFMPAVQRVAILGPVAPYDTLGETWFSGMHQENVRDYRAALTGHPSTRHFALAKKIRTLRTNSGAHFTNTLRSAPENKRLSNAEASQQAVLLEEALRHYSIGWIDEIRGVLEWGFDPRTITQEVLIVFGGKDEFSPPQHAQKLLEIIPRAVGLYKADATHREIVQQTRDLALEWTVGKKINPSDTRLAGFQVVRA